MRRCSDRLIQQSSLGGTIHHQRGNANEKQRRYFSPEFKAEAVKLVTERGYSVAQACRELSIGETAFRRWLAQIEAETQGYVLPGTKPITPEQQRIRELEERIRILEEDKEILKKATALFLSENQHATKRFGR